MNLLNISWITYLILAITIITIILKNYNNEQLTIISYIIIIFIFILLCLSINQIIEILLKLILLTKTITKKNQLISITTNNALQYTQNFQILKQINHEQTDLTHIISKIINIVF